MTDFDVIVLGLGGIGSAITHELSRRGHRVLGIEQFEPVHDRGSSHGETRAIRKAYFEDPRYVPLVLRAYELWDEFGGDLLTRSGCLIMGSDSSPVIRGCLASAQKFSLPHEMLSATTLSERYDFRVSAKTVGFIEPDGGFLRVEKCVEFFQRRAVSSGAELRFKLAVDSFDTEKEVVTVRCGDEEFSAKKLVLALGAWSQKFVTGLQPKRAIQFWFEASRGEDLPVFFHDNGQWIYGFPKIGATLKLAFHSPLGNCDPNAMDRLVAKTEIETIQALARQLIPGLRELSYAKTCIYNMTADEHFILGPHKNVILATGFSGHGFKFAPVVGEIIADFVEEQKPKFDLEIFRPDRFTSRR